MMSRKGPDSVDRIVGRNIRIYRLQRGLTQTELADQLDLTFQQVQKYEKGTNRVGSGRLLKIATYLGVPVTALFKGSDEMADTDKQSIFDQLAKPHDDPITIDSDPYVIIRPEGEWHDKGVLDASSLRPVTSPLRDQKAA